MKKILLILFIVPLVVGCNNLNDKDEKIAYMDRCKGKDNSETRIKFCECCHMELLNHNEDTPEFVDAVAENCMSLLY